MKSISEIKEESQTKVSAMFKELGIIFAFSNEQFEQNKKEGITYVRMKCGMLVPKENSKRVYDELDRINRETQDILKQESTMDALILDELGNHECFYTGNYAEILEIIQLYFPECTLENIRKVYVSKNKN